MRRGFTLVEMIVVAAILAVLAALIFPAFSRAKASAQRTSCISNLRQVGNGIGLYMGDYDDQFPHAVDPIDRVRPEIWDDFPEFQARIPFMPLLHDTLLPYVRGREVFRCPADTGTEVMDDRPDIEFKTSPSVYSTYGTSYFFRTEIAFKSFSSTRFQLPSEVNVLFDASGHWHGGVAAPTGRDSLESLTRKWRAFRYNCLYGDFHVKSVSFAGLRRAWATPLE